MQEVVRSKLIIAFGIWIGEFETILTGYDKRIINAAKSVSPTGRTHIQHHFPKGVPDEISPDAPYSCTACERGCEFPNLVVETGWTRRDSKLAERAKSHIRRSKGCTLTFSCI